MTEALPGPPRFPVMIIQGTQDDQTPLSALTEPGVLPQGAILRSVAGGTHGHTYLAAIEAYVRAARLMLDGRR